MAYSLNGVFTHRELHTLMVVHKITGVHAISYMDVSHFVVYTDGYTVWFTNSSRRILCIFTYIRDVYNEVKIVIGLITLHISVLCTSLLVVYVTLDGIRHSGWYTSLLVT